MISFSTKTIRLLLVQLLVMMAACVQAQTGTMFWATAPFTTPSHDWGHTIHVVVSSMGSPATVKLSIPANPAFTPMTIDLQANSTDYFDFTTATLGMVEMSEWDMVTNKGILIESTDNITAYIEIFSNQNTDIIALKGRNALGTDFYVPFQTMWPNHDFTNVSNPSTGKAFSHFEVVATEDNTVLTITPTQDVYDTLVATHIHKAGVAYTVNLKKGQTYSTRAVGIAAKNRPAGTRITSNKPICVTTSDDSMEINGAYDTNSDQLVPVTKMGAQYIAMKGYLSDKEYVFGVVATDNTTIKVDGVARAKTYQKGDTLIVPLTKNTTLLESNSENNKFTIFHVSGKGAETGSAILPPTDQCTGSQQVGFNFGHALDDHYLYLNLMVRSGAEGDFLVDGAPASWLDATQFTQVGSTDWKVARFELTNAQLAGGNHIITNTTDLFHLGYINFTGPGSLYGYFSDFEQLDISAIAIKSKADTVIACTGELIQLRVDGGLNFTWTGKNDDTGLPATQYLNKTNTYNPVISKTIPMGKYTFTVTVKSACGAGLSVSKDIKVRVVQSPSDINETAQICESEIGSGCIASVDLKTRYTDLLTADGCFVTEWQKDAYNQMITLDDYDGNCHVKYGVNNAGSMNTMFANPKQGWKNPSATVTRFVVGQNMTSSYVTFNELRDYPLDIRQGAVFTLLAMNRVSQSWAKDKFRSLTMTVSNATASLSITKSFTKYDDWEEFTFDFSSLAVFDCNTLVLTVNGYSNSSGVEDFFFDNLSKLFSYRKLTITDPTNVSVCNGEKIYASVADSNTCTANSMLDLSIVPGSFAVNNPTLRVCQSDDANPGVATSVNLNNLFGNIIPAPTTGKSIEKWELTISDYDSIYENFDDVNSYLTWNKMTVTDNPGVTGTLNETTANGNITGINTSTTCGMIGSSISTNGSIELTTDLVAPIDLSQGSVFKLMAAYYIVQNQSTNDRQVQMELTGGGNPTRTSAWVSFKQTGLAVKTWSDWVDAVFDFSAFASEKGFDRITLRFKPGDWQNVNLYIDNFRRQMNPFVKTTINVQNLTVKNGDMVWAVVADDKGCKVKSTVTMNVAVCDPPTVDQVDTLCEDAMGSGKVDNVDLTPFNNPIRDNVTANTVQWFTDKNLNVKVTDTTKVTATDKMVLYALVKNLAKVKQDTATLTFLVRKLPAITFAVTDTVCRGETTFTIANPKPSGGTWTAATYLTAAGVFDPSKATVGNNTVRYTVSDGYCSNTEDSVITLSDTPAVKLATTKQVICQGSVKTIDVSTMFTFTTTGGKADYSCSDAAALSGKTFSKTSEVGKYIIYLTYTVGDCQSRLQDTITVNPKPEMNAGTDDSTCVNTRKKLNATLTTAGTAPYTWSWSPVTNLNSSTTDTCSFTSTTVGKTTYTVIVADSKLCMDTASVTIWATGKPVATLAAVPNDTICQSDTAQIRLNATITGTLNKMGAKSSWTNIASTELLTASLSGKTATTKGVEVKYVYTDGNGCVGDTARTTLMVHAKPVASVTMDSAAYCINAGVKEIKTEPATGGTLSGDGVTDRTFSPTGAGVSPLAHTITFYYEDEHHCRDTATFDVTVNGLPKLSFTQPDLLCNKGAASQLAFTTYPAKGTGVFTTAAWLTKTNDTTASIDPTKVATPSDSNNITVDYVYTAPTGCVSDTSVDIVVYNTPETTPQVQSQLSTETPLDPFDVTTLNYTGVKWYKTAPAFTTLAGTGNTFSPDDIPNDDDTVKFEAGKYYYRYTQTINGCESDTVLATYVITDCPAKKPVVAAGVDVCLSSTAKLSFEATPDNGESLHWYTSIDRSGTELGAGSPLSITPTRPGDSSLYVFPYDETRKCWGPPSLVTRHANQTPKPAFDASVKSEYCYTDTVDLKGFDKNNTTGTGVFTIDNKMVTSIIPAITSDKVYAVTYTYTADSGSCVDSVKMSITVHYVAPPSPTVSRTKVINVGTLEALEAKASPATNTAYWYASKSLTSHIKTGNTYVPTMTDPSKDTVITYYVTQKDGYGCESRPDSAKMTYILCPAKAPVAVAEVGKCFETNLAVTFAASAVNGGTLHWFATNDYRGTELATGNNYTITATSDGIFTRYVFPYDATNQCWGPATAVGRTVYAVPEPQFDASVLADYCYNDTIILKGNDNKVLSGKGVFKQGAIEVSTIILNEVSDKTLSIVYEYTADSGSCVASVTKNINVHYVAPPNPTMPNKKVIGVGTLGAVKATPTGTNTVKWYADALVKNYLDDGASYTPTTPDPANDTVITYYATQTDINGCESQPTTAAMTYTNCMADYPVVADDTICHYEAVPAFALIRGANSIMTNAFSFRVYTQDPVANPSATFQTVANSYTPSLSIPLAVGEHSYYVAEYDSINNCTGPVSDFVLKIRETQALAAVAIPDRCEGTITQRPVYFDINSKINNATIYWYADGADLSAKADVSTNIATGDVYTYTGILTDGTYSFLVSQHDGCQSAKTRVSFTINPKPLPPALTANWSCKGDDFAALTAVGDSIKWYTVKTVDSTTVPEKRGLSFTPNPTSTGFTRYYATQTSSFGCMSDTAGVNYEVRVLPTVDISLPKTNYCVDDAAISFNLVPNTGTTVTGNGVVNSGKDFLPANAGIGTHKMLLTYTENQCTNFDSTEVSVSALPVFSFTDSAYCYTAGLRKPVFTQPANTTAKLLGTGADATNLTFDPNNGQNKDWTSKLDLVITDQNGCDDTLSATMTVTFAESPVIDPVPTYLEDDIALNGTQPLVKILDDNLATSTIEWSRVSDFSTILTGESRVEYNTGFQKDTTATFYARHIENGCKSQPVAAPITVVACPWTNPTTVSRTMCEGGTNNALEAVTTESGVIWEWYSTPTSSTIINNTNTYTPAIPAPLPSKITDEYYVRFGKAEPLSGKMCYTDRVLATRVTNPRPQPLFDASLVQDYCWYDTVLVLAGSEKNNIAGATSFTVDNVATNQIVVSNLTADKIYAVTMNYQTTDGACTNSVSKNITLHYVQAPTVVKSAPATETYKVIGWGTKKQVAVQLSMNSDILKWFDNTGNTVGNTPAMYDPVATEPSTTETRTYTAREYRVFTPTLTCQSPVVSASFMYKPCEAKAPTVSDIKLCEYDVVPTFTLTRQTVNTNLYNYPVFKKNPDSVTVSNRAIDTARSASFTPTDITSPVGKVASKYYFAEYDLTDKCQSKAVWASVLPQVIAAPVIEPISDICEGTETSKMMKVKASSLESGAKVMWYDETTALPAEAPANEIDQTEYEYQGPFTKGTFTMHVSQFARGCQSPKVVHSFVVYEKPSIPDLTGATSCQPYNGVAFTAIPSAGCTIRWFDSNIMNPDTASARKTGITWSPKPSQTGLNIYRAAQITSKGCMSDVDTVLYNYKPKPAAPVVADKAICSYETVPMFRTNAAGQITWYNNTGGIISQVATYTPGNQSENFSVSTTVDGCESDKDAVTFTVHPVASLPSVVSGLRKCYGQGILEVIAANGVIYNWYASNDTTQAPLLENSSTYVYENSDVGVYEIFVTQTDANNCESAPVKVTSYIDSIPAAPVINQQGIALCEYDAMPLLSVTAMGNSYQWYSVSGGLLGNSLSLQTTLTHVPAGTTQSFYVHAVSPRGCRSKASDTVSVRVKQTPSFPAYVVERVECAGDSNAIVFPGAADYFTVKTLSGDSYKVDTSFAISKKMMAEIGVHKILVSQTVEGCLGAFDTVRFHVVPRPAPQVDGPDSLCENSVDQVYKLDNLVDSNTYAWRITGRRTQYLWSQENATLYRTVDWITPGIDTVSVIESNGYCTEVASIVVRVGKHSHPDFDYHIQPGTSLVEFTNLSQQDDIVDGSYSEPVLFKSFSWNFDRNSFEVDTIQVADQFYGNAPMTARFKYGYYNVKLRAISELGCVDSVVRSVFVDMEENIFIPNAFCPSCASPELRTFRPKGFNLETYKIWIYDSWGNLLWYSDKLFNGAPLEAWDGTYDGQVMKVDCYIWKIEASFQDGSSWEGQSSGNGRNNKFGNIILIR